MQDWIRRNNRKRKAAQEVVSSPLPEKRRLTKWQCFLKQFAETEGEVHTHVCVLVPMQFVTIISILSCRRKCC